jgi:hypothetical protein
MKRITEKGTYVNIVPKGRYGDVSGDSHMRQVEEKDAEGITFFLYEEIEAFRRAAANTGLTSNDINNVFYANAQRILQSVRGN